MRRWFLSYHSPDQALGERLKTALEAKDSDARVFFAPSSLRAGGFWSRALAEEIAQADAFILLVGEKGVGDWQELEYDEALDKRVKFAGFPIILVLLEGQTAPGLPFLRRLHWIITPDPSSEKDVARLLDAATGTGTKVGELWRYTLPYRGLAAMEEKDSDYFFGRGRETVDVLSALATAPGRLPVLLGNSGVGKSSLAKAGVLAALKRQAWPEGAGAPGVWPNAFKESRRWCFLTLKPGTEPLKSLVEPFLQIWQFDPTDPRRETRRAEWIQNLHDGGNTLSGLLDATEGRLQERGQSEPPAFLLYVDQGEELYVRAEERQRRRFSEVIAQGISDPRLYTLMSMRSDFLGDMQRDEPLYKIHRQINVPPLREAELRDVVRRPAKLLSARFETAELVDIITRRTVEDSVRDVGALPLLSYTLDDMWSAMVKRDDGVLRLPAQSFELGGVLVDRADGFLAARPESEDHLRRIFTKLATVGEGEDPTRRRAARSEFTDEEWRLVTELADHPNRLLVTATPAAGETYAEVAHEAIFRRWEKLREWIAAEREFLAWRTRLEAARRAWQATPDGSKSDALLMGAALTQAQSWFEKRREDLPVGDRDFIDQSTRRESKARAWQRRMRALVYVLLVSIIGGLIGWINQAYVKEQVNWYWTMRPWRVANVDPYVLKPEAERALKAGDSFKECLKDCPKMVVVPAGKFMMGSPGNEKGRYSNEDPQHEVTIAKRFAVSMFDVTFADWDACFSVGGCRPRVGDRGFGRGTRPVINVNFDDAQQYVEWFSKMTGRTYRLLTEAEWEYAARAGTTTAYFWGDEIGSGNANCKGCRSEWDSRTALVGSFAPNQFGLFDMVGNVSQWVQDCWHASYDDAPTDGSAWTTGDCDNGVVRGGSWFRDPQNLRSADRYGTPRTNRDLGFGIRLGRTLTP
jgi:formylglycine-generating enzyme required for sulfatase activity